MEDQAINLSKKSELFLIKNILNLSNCITATNKHPSYACSSSQNGRLLGQEAVEQSLSKVNQAIDHSLHKEKSNKQSKVRQLNNQERAVDLSLIESSFESSKLKEDKEEEQEFRKDADSGKQQSRRRSRRTMFSEWQLSSLEWRFTRNKYLTTADRKHIAKLLGLNQLQVKTWFQVSSFYIANS